MNNSGIFPFGWIRGVKGENWQIFWSPSSRVLFLKGVTSSRIVEFDSARSWDEAKSKCDNLMSSPAKYKRLI